MGLHDFIMKETKFSKLFIKGFGKWADSKVQQLAGVIATSSHGSDAVLALLLEDDRLVRIADEIDETFAEELKYQQHIHDCIWARLAPYVGMTGPGLRHESCNAALTAAGFTLGRFREVYKLPWSLCMG